MSNFSRNIVSIQKHSGIPSEYQQVEYLLANGTQYIRTQLYADDYVGVKATIELMGSSGMSVFGHAVKNRFGFAFSSNQLVTYFGESYSIKPNFVLATGIKGTVELNYKNSGNVVLGEHTETISFDSPNSTIPFALFAVSTSATAVEEKANLKIYELIVTTRESEKAHFYPCYRKSDNVAGMYDSVNNIFYTNSGSGTFIIGGDI